MSKKGKSAKSSEKFYHKILILTFASLTTVVIMLTVVSYFFVRNQVTSNITAFESEKAARSFVQSSDYFKQFAQSAYFLCDMDYIPTEQLEINTRIWQKKIVSNNISSLIRTNDHISSVHYQNSDFSINTNEAMSTSADSDEIIQAGDYYGCSISVTKEKSIPKVLIGYSSPQSSVEFFINIPSLSGVVLEDNCYLVNGDGMIILSKDVDDIRQNIFEKYKIKKIASEDDFSKISYRDSDYIISAKKDKTSKFYIISIVSDKAYSSQYINLLFEVLSAGILFLLFILGMSYYFVSRTYRPIRSIVETFRYHLPYNVQDFEEETAFINASIEKTISRNEDLENQLKENITKLEHYQAQALHSQISPHFLLNTLENIKWMSVDAIGVDNKVENSLVLLNEIIAESMKQYEMLTTLRSEVRITNNYIELMQHRFKYPFKVTWDIDENIEDNITLKFTLQPLIENTLMRGFNQKRDDQTASITIKPVNDAISITVSDNGCGIAPQKLEEIKADLADKNSAPKKHVGLKNLQLRIQLLFGDRYGIKRLESDSSGTLVEIIIPKNKMQ